MEVTRKLSENGSAGSRPRLRRRGLGAAGQAATEYILMVSIIVGLGLFMAGTLRKSTFGLWKYFAGHIAAACPNGCKVQLK